jgi:hypothetical protein
VRGTAAGIAARSTAASNGLGGLLAWAACGSRLIGHVGQYRHTAACEAFKAAAPRRHRRNAKTNLDHRVKCESYKVEVYEHAIGLAFGHVVISSTLRASTVAAATTTEPEGATSWPQARINHERGRPAVTRVPTAAEARA